MALTVNRYGDKSPTSIQANGIAVSTPIYISLTSEQRKAVLNCIRNLKTKQLIHIGWSKDQQDQGYRLDEDYFHAPPQTPVEELLGMSEDNLRHVLFSRNGIPERLLLRLQRITGIKLVDRTQIESTFSDWLDHLFG